MEKGTVRTAARSVQSCLKRKRDRSNYDLMITNLIGGELDLESRFAVYFPNNFDSSINKIKTKIQSEAEKEGINLSLTVAFEVKRL